MNLKTVCCLVAYWMSMPVMADEQVIVGGNSTAEQYIPIALSLDIGTMGYGGSVIWDVHPKVNVIAGYARGEVVSPRSMRVGGVRYHTKQQDQRFWYVNTAIEPWNRHSNTILKSFYMAGGFAYMDQTYNLTSKTDGQAFGQLEYKNTIAPYLGIGIRPILGLHWGMVAEVGMYYTGHPQLHLIMDHADTAAQKSDVKLSRGEAWQPMAKLGVMYRF